ncbi:hypothetical protein HHK36_001270 [Tetracentron sinense]|uniref:Mitochondrial carrier protein n=1 Tax=Tetracentron sinense TaxID=13715 RepID=A0A834ZVR5_TETSI|nr:hypothetical protein HHK36_001270 [Tetracentron sinense]
MQVTLLILFRKTSSASSATFYFCERLQIRLWGEMADPRPDAKLFRNYFCDSPGASVPYVGLNFAVYESLKDWLAKTKPFGLVDNSELSVTTRLACGAAAGTVGQTVAYPFDVIRRRMQMVGWKDAASIVTGDGRSKGPREYTGMVDAFRKTVRHEGFGALYKGLVPNSVKVVPSIAIAFVTYEMVKDVLGVEMRISD